MYCEIFNKCKSLENKLKYPVPKEVVPIFLEVEMKLTRIRNHDFSNCRGKIDEIKAIRACLNASALCYLILQLQEIYMRTEEGCERKEDGCDCDDYKDLFICRHVCPCAYAEYICDPYIEELDDAIQDLVCHLASSI